MAPRLPPFPLAREYRRCVAELDRAGLLEALPRSRARGVVGIDGRGYPLPAPERVAALFASNRELVRAKRAQGFDRLELVPLALPAETLIGRLTAAIVRPGTEGTVHRSRRRPSDPLVPTRVNAEKQVWVWDALRRVLDTDALAYFPASYAAEHGGMTKRQAIRDPRICAVPGWSVGLVESLMFIPAPGRGRTAGGRRQLESGLSPCEYLEILRTDPYRGESGRTVEDFLTEFLIRLETAGEVSREIEDVNALWCLGHYLRIPYAEVVVAGRWIRRLGRLRLDMHRTRNKKCTWMVGAATTVRLAGTRP